MTGPVKPVTNTDFQTLFHSLPSQYLVLNPELQIVAASNAYLAAMGWRREEVLGRGVVEVFESHFGNFASDAVNKLRASLERVQRDHTWDAIVLETPETAHKENEAAGFRGTLRVVHSAIFGDEGKLLYILQRAEELEERRRMQHLESLGRLAGGVAHDFNNLLGVILACTQMLEDNSTNPELQQRLLTQIRQATNKAVVLTKQLRDAQPLSPGFPEGAQSSRK